MSNLVELDGSLLLKPIKSKRQLDKTVALMKELVMKKLSLTKAEMDYLDVLCLLISNYGENLPQLIEIPTPRERLKYLLEEIHLRQRDLTHLVESDSTLSGFLKERGKQSKASAINLAEYFDIRVSALLTK